jgi:hypothetical protein
MFKRITPVVASALCALALSLIAAPKAHAADLEVILSFEAGKVAQSQVKTGDKATAKKLLTSFAGSWMIYGVDNDSGATWWGVYDANDGHPFAICEEPEYDEEAGSLVFKGQIIEGAFKGAKLTGEVTMDEDGNYEVTQRVTSGKKLDVTFTQALEPIDLQFGSGDDQGDEDGGDEDA